MTKAGKAKHEQTGRQVSQASKKPIERKLVVTVLKKSQSGLFVKDVETGEVFWANYSKFSDKVQEKVEKEEVKEKDELALHVKQGQNGLFYIQDFEKTTGFTSKVSIEPIALTGKKIDSDVLLDLLNRLLNTLETISNVEQKLIQKLDLCIPLLKKSLLEKGLSPEEKGLAYTRLATDVLVACLDSVVDAYLRKNPTASVNKVTTEVRALIQDMLEDVTNIISKSAEQKIKELKYLQHKKGRQSGFSQAPNKSNSL